MAIAFGGYATPAMVAVVVAVVVIVVASGGYAMAAVVLAAVMVVASICLKTTWFCPAVGTLIREQFHYHVSSTNSHSQIKYEPLIFGSCSPTIIHDTFSLCIAFDPSAVSMTK